MIKFFYLANKTVSFSSEAKVRAYCSCRSLEFLIIRGSL